ncbi:WXG100 family type VII secretion target [Streptomyces sp. NPDC015171]|uniref:WXG100 family type VII secretion target n=1 Tax=Streptomyces sp. NPDC015171 TaxID=3364945 RepID=UPI0036F84D02
MPEYALSAEELSAGAQKVDQSAQNIEGMYAHLHRSVSGIASQWQGDAAKAFNGLAERIHANGQKIQGSLKTVAENLKAAGVTYSRQEQEGESAGSGIAGRLG